MTRDDVPGTRADARPVRPARRWLAVAAVVAVVAGVAGACERADRAAPGRGFSTAEVAGPPPAPVPPAAMAEQAVNLKGVDATAGGAATPMPSQAEAAAAQAMIIRTGEVTIRVDSLELATAQVQAMAARLGGYVAGTQMQAAERQYRTASMVLKIPSARFDEAMGGLAPLGKVESRTVSTEDVGEEFVDVQARVANARRLEERLIGLLATRTGKLEEVLAVERELARVREEIERMEGRIRYLRSRVSLSTITVTVHEPEPVIANVGGQGVLGSAFADAWRNFVGFVAGFIRSLGVLIPLAVLGILLFLALRRVAPRLRASASAPRRGPAAPPPGSAEG